MNQPNETKSARPIGACSRFGLALAALLLCAQCGPAEKQPTVAERYHFPGHNVVLVTFDALRADHLGAYGYERNTSPRLDAFAAEASVFTDALSQSATTVYSMASMLTGLFPVTDNLIGFGTEGFSLKQSKLTLAEILRLHGYHTAAVVGHPYAGSNYGFDQGFEMFDDQLTGKGPEMAHETLARSLDMLEKLESPFFFWVHLRQPHDPFDSTEAVFDEFYQPAPGEPTVQRRSHEEVLAHFAKTEQVRGYTAWGETVDMTDSMVRQYEAKYDGNIRLGDDAFGKLVDELDARGLGDRTIVIVASDHGESMGEHQIFTHNFLYYGILHTPVMVRLPSRAHETLTHPVANTDIMPTILQFLGIALPTGLRGTHLFDDQRDDDFQFAEYTHQVTAKVGKFRLLDQHSPPATVMFDVEADPDELTDIFDSFPGVAKALQELTGSMREPSESDRLMSELRSLGYLK